MDLDLVFLGTAGSAPTASRGTSATLVRRGGDRLLVDCGEGTQRQLLRSDAGLVDLEDVLLTHLHADHVLGLPGMLKTFALRGRELPIVVYGPRGTESPAPGARRRDRPPDVRAPGRGARRRAMRSSATATGSSRSRSSTDGTALGYALREDERPGRFDVAAADALGVPDGPARGALQRGEDVSLGGRSRRSGRTTCSGPLAGDGASCSPATPRRRRASSRRRRGADVLVHEATFLVDERARARETEHSTAGEAALRRARGGRRAARADARLGSLRRARRSRRRRGSCFPTRSCRATSTSSRCRCPSEARRSSSRAAGRRERAQDVGSGA